MVTTRVQYRLWNYRESKLCTSHQRVPFLTLVVAGAMSYRFVPSLNRSAVFAGVERAAYRLRSTARMIFITGGTAKIGTGLGDLFGRLNAGDQIFPKPRPTLLSSGPKKAALFPAAELTR